ncbi:uncharacterized protein [Solanum lycopersicum]|uniref:uncharacterized protein n=1 Tax=Solanum lycopersicum TaxID=4081 RepID=UPI0008FEB111|nr:uncharacterized protein LOC109120756 [Solanum lycopersicum]
MGIVFTVSIISLGKRLIMLIYLPIRRYILRRDIRSRKLYLTPNAIVTRLVPFPCFGDLKEEKYVLLPSVADIAVEQGYLQSHCGVYSIRIENVGVRRSPSDDLQIQGIADALDFRKVVLTQLSNLRSKAFSRQASAVDDTLNLQIGLSCTTLMSPSRPISMIHYLILEMLHYYRSWKKLEVPLKRVQNLIEEHHLQTSEHAA